MSLTSLMQDRQLLISGLLTHAARNHGDVPVVSHLPDGQVRRSNWREVSQRAKRLARALTVQGLQVGERVGTLAWNTHRHLELYYAVSGSGAVLHTVNPRLFPEQIAWIINHAEDQVLCFDLDFADLVLRLAPELQTVKRYVALCSRDQLPALDLPGLCAYDELVDAAADDYVWPEFSENTPSALCYTSGTTGHPKGVLYTHRSTVLHSFGACATDGLGLGSRDCVLLSVPMFHVNAWGMPYATAMCGAKLVLPGPVVTGERLFAHMVSEGATMSLGVPTVWLGFFQYLEQHQGQLDLKALKLNRVMVGGSAAPMAIIRKFQEVLGVFVVTAWGMTETSPVATVGNLLGKHEGISLEDRYQVQVLAGRPMYPIEVEVFDADGQALPHDGRQVGELRVRGPWVLSGYFGNAQGSALDDEGWFSSGDVANMNADGYVQITDRSKDVIKSGGEWISSIDLENSAVGHPQVQEEAVGGVHHGKWQERPLLVVVPKAGEQPTAAALLDFLKDRVARWWLPDDVVFVTELPHTATGKLLKTKLREQFKNHKLPTDTDS